MVMQMRHYVSRAMKFVREAPVTMLYWQQESLYPEVGSASQARDIFPQISLIRYQITILQATLLNLAR